MESSNEEAISKDDHVDDNLTVKVSSNEEKQFDESNGNSTAEGTSTEVVDDDNDNANEGNENQHIDKSENTTTVDGTTEMQQILNVEDCMDESEILKEAKEQVERSLAKNNEQDNLIHLILDDEDDAGLEIDESEVRLVSLSNSSESVDTGKKATTTTSTTTAKDSEESSMTKKKQKKKNDATENEEKSGTDTSNCKDHSVNVSTPKQSQVVTSSNSGSTAVTTISTNNSATTTTSTTKLRQSPAANRNLWIMNISRTTRATELSRAFSQYGKVVGAKVVADANHPASCCFGYVTMGTVEQADKCIEKLDNTELNGQIIHIQKTRPDQVTAKKSQEKDKDKDKDHNDDNNKRKSVQKDEETKRDVSRTKDHHEKKDDGHKSDSSAGRKRDSKRSTSPRKSDREKSPGRQRRNSKSSSQDILTFDKIKQERERQRIRTQERVLREESRRHREEALRQKEIERIQRKEGARLEKEREKLRIEREKLEREKSEIIRLERERQKLEREKLEFEKLELQRAKMFLQEEDRRIIKHPITFDRRVDFRLDARKRPADNDRRFDNNNHASKFDSTSLKPRDTSGIPTKKFSPNPKARPPFEKHDSYGSKRERYEEQRILHNAPSSSRNTLTTVTKYEGSSMYAIGRDRDIRTDNRHGRDNPIQPSTSSIFNRLSKEARYSDRERDRSPHYNRTAAGRDDRDRRSNAVEHKDVRCRDHRYSDTSKDGRFDRMNSNSGGGGGGGVGGGVGGIIAAVGGGSSSSGNWSHSNTGTAKEFGSINAGPPKGWSKDSWGPAESSTPARWVTNTSNSRGGHSMNSSNFSNSSALSMNAPSCPPPPQIKSYGSDRFDYNISSMRKY